PRRRLVHRRHVRVGTESPQRLPRPPRHDRRVRESVLRPGPAELIDGVQLAQQGQVRGEPPEALRLLVGPALAGALLRPVQPHPPPHAPPSPGPRPRPRPGARGPPRPRPGPRPRPPGAPPPGPAPRRPPACSLCPQAPATPPSTSNATAPARASSSGCRRTNF